MATNTWTDIADYILDDLWGYASVNTLVENVKYLAEILGDPQDNSDSVSENFSNNVWETYSRPTGASVAKRGVAVSSSSTGLFNTTSASLVDVTNATVTIETTGRPVLITMIPDGSSSSTRAMIGVSKNGSSIENSLGAYYAILRGSSIIAESRTLLSYPSDTEANHTASSPPSAIQFVDFPSAGTYTYKLQISVDDASTNFAFVSYSKMVAFEL